MSSAAPGLTTTKSPFIEQVVSRGELYVPQPWELYSEENHQTWAFLFRRMMPRWEQFATARFLEGVGNLALDTTITIRDGATPDYLPEPDIFHDIAGHVPMHTDPAFVDTLARFGQTARAAAERLAEMQQGEERLERLNGVMRAMARFFWFTIEFGLMEDPARSNATGVRAYGSGLLSSYGELAHAVESPRVQRFPFQLEWVVNQPFEIYRYQPLLFTVHSFDHLFQEVERLERWMLEGRLDHVAQGEPVVSDEDLRSALDVVEQVEAGVG